MRKIFLAAQKKRKTSGNIIHGNYMKMKRQPTRKDMFLSPREPMTAVVLDDKLENLFNLTISLIKFSLLNNDFYNLSLNHSDDTKKFNEYFNGIIF